MNRKEWPKMPDKLGMKYNPNCENKTCKLGYVRTGRLCLKCNPVFDERKLPFGQRSSSYWMDATMGTRFGD